MALLPYVAEGSEDRERGGGGRRDRGVAELGREPGQAAMQAHHVTTLHRDSGPQQDQSETLHGRQSMPNDMTAA